MNIMSQHLWFANKKYSPFPKNDLEPLYGLVVN